MSVLTDGMFSRISLTGAGVTFFEKEITPPGIDAGGPNDTSTLRNVAWRTKQPKKLKTLTEFSAKVAYDVIFYSTTVAQVGINQLIIVTFPDGHTLSFWGWLDKFTPDALKDGAQPEATVKFECSNQNNSGVEVAPIYG